MYLNAECAWQSLKTEDCEESNLQIARQPWAKTGRSVILRKDWEKIKYDLMVKVCFAKFFQNEDLKEARISTGDELIIENTTGWHDNIWGNCDCEQCRDNDGMNLLGKAIMEVWGKLKNDMA